MEPGGRNILKKAEARIALRSILGDFFADRSVSEACWYRLISGRDKYIPSTEKPSHIPALSRVFGISDRLSDELLLACGLLYYHGDQLRVRKKEWESLIPGRCRSNRAGPHKSLWVQSKCDPTWLFWYEEVVSCRGSGCPHRRWNV
jgi:hypothetical protein